MMRKICILLPMLLLASCAHTVVPDFKVGMDIIGNGWNEGDFLSSTAMDSLNLDYVIYHIETDSTVAYQTALATMIADRCAEKGADLILNVETVNSHPIKLSSDGFDYGTTSEGLHRFVFPDSYLKALSTRKNVIGIQYDELEHTQLTRTLSITMNYPDIRLVSLAETTGMDFREADNAVYEGAKKMVEENRRYGMDYIVGEHVWPVLFHNFARAGITPVYKQMKENWSDVFAAIAAGASLQYGQELWACLDFWRFTIYPGHSADEFAANLRFAYWMGVDRLYSESTSAFRKRDGASGMNENGRVMAEFTNEYIKENPRPYTFRDYLPEIAIIRFDDTCWGQGPDTYVSTFDRDGNVDGTIWWKDMLFGSKDLRRNEASMEWIKAWNTITHGQVSDESLSYNAENVYGGKPYRAFAAMNSPVVFDQTVRRPLLKSVKLAFLCGQFIDEETLKDVTSLVKKGMIAVTSARFAPSAFSEAYAGGTQSFNDGKGSWIITDDMSSNDVKAMVAPYLGKDDEITLRFKNDMNVVFRIADDGNSFDDIIIPIKK